MAFGRRPVASLGKRSVYKTEFDIFKQNTDIELISLVSFDENDSCHLENRSSYWSSKTSSSGHKTQNNFTSQRKNFEQLNRNSVRIAYDPNYKCSKAIERNNREFKPNIWNKGDTSIYKAFARTSKSFLKNRTYGRKVERSRSCYSANEVRKPTNEELKLTRCQSTCERRTNESNWITNSKSNKQNSANVENKENTINRSVNRQNASTNKALWRTKSAPVTTAQNKPLYTRKQELLGYTARGKSAKPSSRIEKGQAEEKPNVGRTGTLNEKRDFINSQKTRSQESPKELSINRIELERDVNTRTNKVIEECTGSNYSCKNLDSEVNTEKQSSDISVKSEVDSVCKSDNNVNTINENTSRDLEITADETPGSKDSGFASNTVSPELEVRPVEADGGTEQTEPSKKQVKFACEDIEDGASSVDICSVVTECALSDNESIANESDLNALDKHDISTYDITTLLNDLERFGANSRLSVISAGCHSIYSHEGGNDSLCGVEACKHLNELKAPEEESNVEEPDQELIDSAISDLESTNMSKEARHAILETLQDMGVKKDRRGKDLGGLNDLKHRSVNLQRKQKDNRHKYEYFMRERTKSFYKQQFKSMDSVGNDDTSSRHSSSNTREGDDSTSDELKGKLFPTITEMSKSGFRTNRSKQPKQIVTLENVRHKKHKIPGIGNYHMIASPDSDFEITPPGFDIRYNRPIISTEEMEIPPRFIRERSIQKCKNWLKRNISLSPLSLQPAANNKQLSRD